MSSDFTLQQQKAAFSYKLGTLLNGNGSEVNA